MREELTQLRTEESQLEQNVESSQSQLDQMQRNISDTASQIQQVCIMFWIWNPHYL